ncbi:aspartate racemase [Idiomarina aquatica]|uniref:Aspartate racemase n=1 Tax=Idiomarina aquatica TaxID=1327752 RepID=A0A4R6PRP1_9GAMM|nr:aspartate/glutamate racemase family protein [Idiomarina aquatica]TDP40614.1 aspartate racemase [Idiomarina aquatica]
MKTIGIIGGMSWESTLSYYRLINQKVNAKLGGLHSAKIIINSVDFADIEPLQRHGDWNQAGERLMAAAKALESAGADGFLIATNTMHKVAPQVEAEVNIPLIHIVDATALALQQKNVKTVGLVGTRFTMEQAFYRERLEQYGINVLTPDSDARQQIHDIIFNELCHGVTTAHSRQCYVDAIDNLAENGAQAVILGCTEIGLLISQSDTQLPLFDTTEIHTDAAVQWMPKDTK